MCVPQSALRLFVTCDILQRTTLLLSNRFVEKKWHSCKDFLKGYSKTLSHHPTPKNSVQTSTISAAMRQSEDAGHSTIPPRGKEVHLFMCVPRWDHPLRPLYTSKDYRLLLLNRFVDCLRRNGIPVKTS